MKRLMGVVALTCMTLTATVNATPTQSVTTEKVMTEEGYVLTKEGNSVVNIIDNITATYMQPEGRTIDSIVEGQLPTDKVGAISTVVAEQAIVREEPNQDSNIVNYINQDIPVFVSEKIDNYYKVEIEGIEGYIYREQLDETTLATVPYTRSELNTPPAENPKYLGNEVVEYAKQFLGNPYVYGGNSLTKGTDCSGFTSQVFKNFGINLQRSSRSQYASNGYKVSKDQLLPGDLVFYGYNGHIDHVAIYAGNGQIVHASTPKTGICMGKLEYGKPIIGMKRVIK